MRKDRVFLITGEEYDWVNHNCRRVLGVFENTTGLGKKVKHAINKRARRKCRQELIKDVFDD